MLLESFQFSFLSYCVETFDFLFVCFFVLFCFFVFCFVLFFFFCHTQHFIVFYQIFSEYTGDKTKVI